MPVFPRNKFSEKIDSHETRGLIFIPETLAEAEARLAGRASVRSRTPSPNLNMNSHKRTLIKIGVISILFLLLLISQYGSYLGRPQLNKLLYSDNQTDNLVLPGNVNDRIDSVHLQLNLPHCKIPKVPLYNQHYVPSDILLKSCENEYEFSTLVNGVVELKDPGLQSTCCVSEIIRPYEFENDTFQTGPCIPFNNSTSMEVKDKEFISVACTRKYKRQRFNFHASVLPKADFLQKKVQYWQGKQEVPINVLVLVLDSTSSQDAYRQIPRTMDFLENELKFINFKGFHHLGEPTMLNAIPLLFGVPSKEFFGKIKQSWEERWDSSPFIWKEFSKSNYATAYIEDIPDVGTFNYGFQTGFTYKPTDFYLRPLFLANVVNMGNRQQIMASQKACLGKVPIEKYVLDYQLEMLKKMNGLVPIFSMPWLCWPQHDFAGTLFKLENTTLNFFKALRDTPGLLENTLTIVMADHGFYTGPYANSHEGLLERRLPLFRIRLPEKLISKYPEFLDRIRENSNRITSHFDVYKTLLHLAQLAAPRPSSVPKGSLDENYKKFGLSLFDIIPESRTCSDAGIPENNCACNLPAPPSDVNSVEEIPSIMNLKPHSPYF